MFPFPVSDDDDDGVQVPLELAKEVFERVHAAVKAARADNSPDGVLQTLERKFGLKPNLQPEDIPPELLPEIMAYLDSKEVTVGLGDLNILLAFITDMMEKLGMTLKFAQYLHDNGHERIGTYLHTLATLPTAPIE